MDDATGGSSPGRPPDENEEARFAARVLRAFVRDGRLVSIPAQDRKRQVILRWLLDRCFPTAEVHAERDVNMRLALIHPDVAALRRYLVDAGLMTRASGEYRRAVPPARSPGPAGPDGASAAS